MDVQAWENGLKQVGLYYEGYVEDTDLIDRSTSQPRVTATVPSCQLWFIAL